jgi:hypothetical protein
VPWGNVHKGSEKVWGALQNEELEEGLSGNNNSDNDSGPAGRQRRRAGFGEELSFFRQES